MADLAGRLKSAFRFLPMRWELTRTRWSVVLGARLITARLSKTYSFVNLNKDAASRYARRSCESRTAHRYRYAGREPDFHVARRKAEPHAADACRRLTRLTNAFSKKFENFQAAVALNFAYYNFVQDSQRVAYDTRTSGWR